MSRFISSDRMSRILTKNEDSEISPGKVQTACLHTHQKCMGLLVHQLEMEAREGVSDSERLAIILACAQVCHSVSTLCQLKSEYLPRLLNTCIDICTSCAELCDQSHGDTEANECVAACLNCIEVCALFLRQLALPVRW